jgi:hypothetical protein
LALGAAFLRAVRLSFLRSALSLIFVVSATLTSFHRMCSESRSAGFQEINVNRRIGANESMVRGAPQ